MTGQARDLDEAALRALADPECVSALLGRALELSSDDGPVGLRERRSAAFAALPAVELPPGVRVREVDRPHLRVFEPDDTSDTAVLWLHGGALIAGTPRQDDLACARMALEHSVPVVAVYYRLAPEHPYPSALDDGDAALAWVRARPDVARVVVAGASAGGGLALALAMRARDQGSPVAGLALQYPMLDDRPGHRSLERIGVSRLWDAELIAMAWRAYLGPAAGSDGVDPLAAPGRALVEQLRGLPPTVLDVGTLDGFFDEVLVLAERLARADVPLQLLVTPGAFHGSEVVAPHAVTSRRILGFRRDGLRVLLQG